jgi:ParB-like chromosome segregation protein Spo0J
MKVEQWPIKNVKPYDKNPRKNDDAVGKVALSIKTYGFRQPIVVDKDGIVIVGHTRLKAAKTLGMTKVPVHVADLTPDEARAYRIADNRTGEDASWDALLLGDEIELLNDAEFDIDLLGFEDGEIERMLENDGVFDVEPVEPPAMRDGDREPFTQMTFTLHDDQAADVKAAIDKAKAAGPFGDGPNENSNGNALARIVEAYLG